MRNDPRKPHFFRREGSWCVRFGRFSVGPYYRGSPHLEGIAHQVKQKFGRNYRPDREKP